MAPQEEHCTLGFDLGNSTEAHCLELFLKGVSF